MIRVAIVTDSAVIRAGLASVFGAGQDVQVVSAGEEPDVVVWVAGASSVRDDTTAPWDGDLDDGPHRPATMVLLERMDVELARDAYAGGANAVLALDARDEELAAALRAAAAGLVVMQPAVSGVIAVRATPGASHAATATPVSLTPREREVLSLLAEGLANKAIAPRLGITEHTVKTHIAAVYEKLNARNRAEALIAAARQGLVAL